MEISNGHSRVNMSCINNHTPLYFSNKYHNRKIILYFIHLVYRGRIVEANRKETNRLGRRWAWRCVSRGGTGTARMCLVLEMELHHVPTYYRGRAPATSPIDNDTDRRKAATRTSQAQQIHKSKAMHTGRPRIGPNSCVAGATTSISHHRSRH
jgi:hypothetical protein